MLIYAAGKNTRTPRMVTHAMVCIASPFHDQDRNLLLVSLGHNRALGHGDRREGHKKATKKPWWVKPYHL